MNVCIHKKGITHPARNVSSGNANMGDISLVHKAN